jgi:hypothetical protein
MFGGDGNGSFHFSSQSGSGVLIDPDELFDALEANDDTNGDLSTGVNLQRHVRLTSADAVFGASHNLHLRYHLVNRARNQGTRCQSRHASGDWQWNEFAPVSGQKGPMVIRFCERTMKRRAKVEEVPEFWEGKPKAAGLLFNRIFGSEPEIKERPFKVDTALAIDNGMHLPVSGQKGPKLIRCCELLRAYDEEVSQSGVTGISIRIAKGWCRIKI